MKAVLVSSSDAFGRSLQHLLPAWLEFTPVDSIEKLLGGFSAIDCACVFLHAERITPRLITSLNKAGQRRFQTLFVVADILDRDWEEQAYHAGAAWVFEAPLRPMIFRRQVERFLPPPKRETALSPDPFQLQSPPPATPPAPAPRQEILETMRNFGKLLRHATQAETFIEQYILQLREILAVTRVALYLTDLHDPRSLHCASATGVPLQFCRNVTLSLENGVGRHAHERSIALTVTTNPFGLDEVGKREMQCLGMQLAIPIRSQDGMEGILLVGPTVMGLAVAQEKVELLFLLMEEVGLVIRNARLYEELMRERRFITSILEQLRVGCLIFDEEPALIHSNKLAAAIFGHASEDELSLAALPNELASLIFQVSQRRTPRASYQHRTPARETYLITIEYCPDADPRRATTVVIAHNHTEIIRAQGDAVAAANGQLLRAFGDRHSHIFNNALTQLDTLSQMFSANRDSFEFLNALGAALPQSLQRLRRYVDQIRYVSRPSGEPVRDFDLALLVRESWTYAAAVAEASKSMRLQTSLSEPIYVRGAVNALRAALTELLVNAIQAAPNEDVVVTIETSERRMVAIGIHDAGPGLPSAALAGLQLFRTEKSSGLGLGLSVVREILREHQAELTADTSRITKGARLGFRLPASL